MNTPSPCIPIVAERAFSSLQEHGGKAMRRDPATILQLNIGLYCNQACSHCHVESSPRRTEMMDRATAEQCVRLMAASLDTVKTVDITGGAPEMNSQFRCTLLLCPSRRTSDLGN